LDSEDENRIEKICVDEESILNLFNNYSLDEIQSTINISGARAQKISALRPFIDLEDLVRFKCY
jgi:hypothetical protein